jgi:hypothetical protein
MLLKEPEAFEALVFTKVADSSEEDVKKKLRPFRGVINIGECVHVGQLSEKTFQAILKGCTAPGVNMEKEHVDKREQIYSFIDISPCFFKREGEIKRLIQCMALSRLVFPTSLSTDFYCYIETEGARQKIYPRNSGLGTEAFHGENRDFLTNKEMEDLKIVCESYWQHPLTGRLGNALWYHEYLSYIKHSSVRCSLAVTGLESLIHTCKGYSRKQFVDRIQQLSQAVGSGNLPEKDAEEMYEMRCGIVHGNSMGGVGEKKLPLLNKMEEVLRLSLRKSIIDPHFAAIFENEESIQRQWPVSIKGGKKCDNPRPR